jgi:putative pyoverdin transport system ATP-binding/permease protein
MRQIITSNQHYLEFIGKENYLSIVIILVLNLIAAICHLLVIYFINKTLATIESFSPYYSLTCILFFVLYVFNLRWGFVRSSNTIETSAARLRNSIVDKIRHSELKIIEELHIGEIVIKLTRDVQTLARSLSVYLSLIQVSIFLTLVLIYLCWVSFKAFLIISCFVLIGLIYFHFQKIFIQKKTHQLQRTEEELFSAVSHRFLGFKELKINAVKSIDFNHRCLNPLLAKIKKLRITLGFRYSGNATVIDVLKLCIFGFILMFFSSSGELLPILIIVYTLDDAIWALMCYLPDFWKGIVAMERINQLNEKLDKLYIQKINNSGLVQEFDASPFKQLKINDLTFKYTDKQGDPLYLLGPLDLTVNAGEILFIIGGNGSGKSTLMKIISGLYPPYSGVFTLDSEKVRISDYQFMYSIIFSDYYPFDRFWGIDQIDHQKLIKLLNNLDLNHKTQWDGEKFTHTDLSTGQKKRLALILSLMEDKEIFIFDEWAAEQDPEFRYYFYHHVLSDLKAAGKAVIIVSHDDQYFKYADRIVKMENGRIAATIVNQ